MKLNNYPSYKPCNIDWCRLIPDHWKQAQLRVCIDFATNGLSCNQTEQTATTTAVSRIETISEGKFNFEKVGYIERSEADTRRLMRKGDLAFSNINSLSMIGNCAILDSDDEIYAGMNLLHVRPKQTVDPKWLYWLMRSNSFRSDVESNSKPAINQASIPQSKLVSIQIPIPQSKLEQSEISRFLDLETAKIDALIAKQERLIELLQEKRQAVISHAVTKGLNPVAPMKDSGVEWLGEVPENWRITKLSYLISTRKGVAFKSEDFCNEGIPVSKASDIKSLSLREASTYIGEEFASKFPKAVIHEGEIIISTVGSNPDVKNSAAGQLCMVPAHSAGNLLNQNTAVFTPLVWSIDNQFLFFSLLSRRYRDTLDLSCHGTATQ